MTDATSAAAPAPTGLVDAQNQPIQRISTATLILGTSGAGKTSLLKTLADYLWETYGKVLFLYSWDGGAIPTDVQKGMKHGIIRFWRVRTRSANGLGIETLYKATKGYVPRHINPMTGETAPAVELIPPIQSKYVCTCPKGHPLLIVPVISLIQPTYCNDCKALIDRGAIIVREESKRTKGLELIGGVAFDGLTSMSTVVMDHMDHARGAGDVGGEKSAFGGVVVSGDIKLGGNNRADVGFGQSRAQQFVNNSLSIPFLVEGPVFTALSAEASEEGLPIVGAKLPGRAATDEASSWFGNVLEAATVNDPETGKRHRRLFIRPFIDSSNRKHLLKTSGSPGNIPDWLQDGPEDDRRPFTGFNLGLYYKMLDDDLRKAVGSQSAVTDAMADYGEAVAFVEPQKLAAPAALPAPNQAGLPAPAASVGQPATTGGLQVPQGRKNRSKPVSLAPAAPPSEQTTQPTTDTAAAEPVAASTGGPPPPPGARPPQRAPGT